MRIVKFVGENVKRLKCVQIEPKGDIVQISGPNGAGKSSVLDAIWWTLGGTRDVQKQPIRHGTSEGHTELDLGEYVVRRKFSATGTTLQVERKDGSVRLDKPQAVLDKLIGKIAFDPLAFSRMKPKDQFDQLRKLVKIDVDIDKLDELNQSDFLKRTELNRQAKTLRGRLDGITIAPGLPDEKIDISSLASKVEEAATHNKNIEIEKAYRAHKADEIRLERENITVGEQSIESIREEIRSLEGRIAKIESDNDRRKTNIVTIEQDLRSRPPIGEPIDVSEVRKKIDSSVMVNSQIDRRSERIRISKEIQDLDDKSRDLTDAMESRQNQKVAAIAAAQFPVEGLGFGSNEVLLNGVPFEQASSAEQLRASCAIAMAMNPELRVISIRDASLLDDRSVEILRGLAKDKDFQIWMEVVDTSGTVGIVLEDGVVVADNQKS